MKTVKKQSYKTWKNNIYIKLIIIINSLSDHPLSNTAWS